MSPMVSLNTPHALKFRYQSTSANPSAVLPSTFLHNYTSEVNHTLVTALPKRQRLMLSVGTEFREFAYAPVDQFVSEHRFLWDALQSTGDKVKTGSYTYEARLRSTFDGYLPGMSTPSGVEVDRDAAILGRARIVNRMQGPFGAGWTLEDLWDVHPNPDDSALLVRGDGESTHYKKGYGTGLIAGQLTQKGFGGDGGSARQALISGPRGFVVDPAGNLVFSDSKNHRLRRIDTSGVIQTIAGTGSGAYSGDGGPAAAASLNLPTHLAIDASGNIYVNDSGNFVLRRISASGTITTVLAQPDIKGLAVSPGGTIYLASFDNSTQMHVVQRIDPGGTDPILFAGGGLASQNQFGTPDIGDGGPAVGAALSTVGAIAYDPKNNTLYIVDTLFDLGSGRSRIRKVDCGGIITTVATGRPDAPVLNDVFVANAGGAVVQSSPLTIDAEGSLYFVGPSQIIRRLTRAGFVETVAGRDALRPGPTPLVFFDGSGTQEGSSVAFPGSSAAIVGLGMSATGDLLFGVDDSFPGAGVPSFIATAAHVLGVTFFKSPTGDASTLRQLADGSYRHEDPDRTVHTFDTAGRGKEVKDRNGIGMTFTHSSDGLLTEVRDPGGRVTTFAYSGRKIQSATDSAGRVTSFTVDGTGDLVRVTYPDYGQRSFAYQDHLLQTSTTEAGDSAVLTYGTDQMVRSVREPDGATITFRPSDSQYLVNDLALPGQINSVPAVLIATTAYQDLVTMPNDRTTRYQTDAYGAPLRTEDPLGRVTQAVRDDNGQATESIMPNGNKIVSSYGPRGELLRSEDKGTGAITQYRWSPAFLITTAVIDPLGNMTRTELDERGNAVKVTFPDLTTTLSTYNDRGQVTSSTDRRGFKTDYSYDSFGNQVGITNPDLTTRTIARTPDGHVESMTDEEGHGTSYTYTPFGLVEQVTNAKGKTRRSQYDSRRRLIGQTDELNRTTRMTYDSRDRLVRQESPTGRVRESIFDIEGNLRVTIDPKLRRTTMDYDAARQRIRQTQPGNVVTEYSYGAASGGCVPCAGPGGPLGLLTMLKDPEGNETRYSHDVSGQTTAITDALGGRTEFTHDIVGNVTVQKDPDGLQTTTAYNSSNRPTSVTDPRTGRIVREFDANGSVTKETNDANQVTEREYNSRQWLVRITVAAGTTDATTTRFEYDKVGNRTAVITRRGRWSYAYNELNLVTTETDPNHRSATFQYDDAGRLVMQTDRNLHTTEYRYNDENERTAIIYHDGSRVDMTYDSTGQRKTVTDVRITIQNDYDDLDRPVYEFIPQLGRTLSMEYNKTSNRIALSINGARTAYSYDPLQRLVAMQHSSGASASWEYNPIGLVTRKVIPGGIIADMTYDRRRLSGMTYKTSAGTPIESFNYFYDSIANLQTMTDGEGFTAYMHDSQGRLTSVSYPDQTSEAFTYSPEGNRTQHVKTTASGSRTAVSTFDAADQILATLETAGTGGGGGVGGGGGDGGGPSPSPTPFPSGTPSPDPSVFPTPFPTGSPSSDPSVFPTPFPSGTSSPGPSPTGSPTLPPGPSPSASGSPSAGPTPFPSSGSSSSPGAASVLITFTHDNNGNLTAISTASSESTTVTTSFTYDVRDRMTRVTLPGGQTIDHEYYPGSPLRYSTTPAGGAVRYELWDMQQQNPLQDLDASHAVVAEYIHGSTRRAVGLVVGGATYAYVTDHLGSVRYLVGSSGSVANSYRYQAFGGVRRQTEGIANKLLFTGHQREQGTGQYYAINRVLDPGMGRWLQRDPLGISAGLNHYQYVNSRPLALTDPSGLAVVGMGGFLESTALGFGNLGGLAQLLATDIGEEASLFRFDQQAAAFAALQSGMMAKPKNPVIIVGNSFGARSAVLLAQKIVKLPQRPCKVLLATIDPIDYAQVGATFGAAGGVSLATLLSGGSVGLAMALGGLEGTVLQQLNHFGYAGSVPPEVKFAYNVYQRNDLLLQGGLLNSQTANTQNTNAVEIDPGFLAKGNSWFFPGHFGIENSGDIIQHIRRTIVDHIR